jgi:hypothetical protein
VEKDTFLQNPSVGTDELLERHALATLYYGLRAYYRTGFSNWLTDASHCEWEFVGCNEIGSVVTLQIEYISLQFEYGYEGIFQGSLPAEIGRLSNLNKLLLAGDEITCQLPVELYDLTMLEQMSVAGNNFTGSIDKAIGRLTRLRSIEFTHNLITSHLPSAIGFRFGMPVGRSAVGDEQ